jgi:murein DD-endopeptidase MepM/ murein hydrolase activator NlpD
LLLYWSGLRSRNLYYILILGGVLSLFATCRNNAVEDEGDITEDFDDTAEVVLNDLEDDTDKIPSKIELDNKNYKFQRNKNPYAQDYFRNPFDSAIYVSGTFCELRGNHFHGGLDIRTGGREGWSVLAVADGYVERVKVSVYGYGRVVYVRHPNGYTSVYGHLQKFTGALANYVKEAQYKQRKFEIELFPKPGEIKVVKGKQFALSGNTGGSGGPHLHFEIRNPQGKATNPLMHGLKVTDKLKPQIKNISVYLKDKEELYSKGNYPYMVLPRKSQYLNQSQTLNVKPGTYSFGLRTDDYFTDRNNRLGINYCWLTGNGKLLYQYQIEKFDFTMGRYINAHIDPYLKNRTGLTYIRLFKEKFNPLPYYKQAQNGEVWLKHGDSIQMKMYIQDYVGLTDSVVWVMVGDSSGRKLTITERNTFDQKYRVDGKKGKTFSYKEWKISIPGSSVYHNFDFKLSEEPKKPNMLCSTLQMHYPYTPLHSYINVTRKVTPEMKAFGSKLCAVSFSGKRVYYEGGELSGDYLSFRTRSLGEYAITHDSKPPVIRVVRFGKRYKFKVSDNLSGVSKIICSLDDKWILSEYEPKTNSVWGEIPNWIKPGKHNFKLVVIDSKNNRAEYTNTITL